LTPEIAHDLCQRTASTAVLEGSIASLGSQYVLGLRATTCQTDDVMAEEQAQAARKEDVLAVLSQMASKFRTRIGESLSTVEKHNTPLEKTTTPSLEALKAYSEGVKLSVTEGGGAAMPLFKRAVEIDPNFAMAHALLALQYSGVAETALAVAEARRAYELRDRTSDHERFFIVAGYHRDVTGDLEKAAENLRLWGRTYPR